MPFHCDSEHVPVHRGGGSVATAEDLRYNLLLSTIVGSHGIIVLVGHFPKLTKYQATIGQVQHCLGKRLCQECRNHAVEECQRGHFVQPDFGRGIPHPAGTAARMGRNEPLSIRPQDGLPGP